jgi:alpha-ribazole phosphatase/probable phosphoglycerate mutase
MTVIDLIRHGEPEGGRRYRGATDDPLSPRGWSQMVEAVGGDCPWSHIVTSPLSRCSDFARWLGERHGVPVTVDVRLQEQGFGVWEGRSPDELRREDPEQLQRFYSDPVGNRPAGAESSEDFRNRIAACWRELLDRHRDHRVLVVGHAGTVRAVVSLVLGTPPENMFRVAVSYAARVQIRADGERPPALYLGR